MKLFRRIIAVVLAVSGMSLCTVPSRGDQYYAATTVAPGSQTINITDSAIGFGGGGYYADYQTTVGTSTDGGTTIKNPVIYNTFCVDLTHEATGTFNPLATPALPLTSSYTGGGTTGASPPTGTTNAALGDAAWLANTYAATSTDLAGLQIAIWKVLYESSASTPDWSVTDSHAAIYFSGNTSATNDAQTYVNDWLNAGKPTSSALLVNYAYYPGQGNTDHPQYQLIPVPEPSTLAVACLGVIGFAGYGLKRSRRIT